MKTSQEKYHEDQTNVEDDELTCHFTNLFMIARVDWFHKFSNFSFIDYF